MKEEQSNQHIDCSEHTADARKPFEAPQLRREAGLTEATAERMFTFGAPSS